VYYASPAQVNILTPPDAMSGPVQVQVASNGASAGYTQQAAAVSPSFFVFNGGPYAAATHTDGSLLGPASWYPGATTPAQPGETIVLYANGIGPTSNPVTSGSAAQSGVLSPAPVVMIGGATATMVFAGAGGGGRVPIQRGGHGRAGEWGPNDHGDVQRGVDAGWSVDRGAQLAA